MSRSLVASVLLLSCAAARPGRIAEVRRPPLPCAAVQAPVEVARIHTDAPVERMVATNLGLFLFTARGLYLLPTGAREARRWSAEVPSAMVTAGEDTFWMGENLHSIHQGVDAVVPARCPDGLLEALGNPETAPSCFGTSLQLEGDTVYFKNPIGQIFSLPKTGGTARPIDLRRFDCLIARNGVDAVRFVSRGKSALSLEASMGCADDAEWIDLDDDAMLIMTGDHRLLRVPLDLVEPSTELFRAPGWFFSIAVQEHRVLFAHHLGESDPLSLFAIPARGGPLSALACQIDTNERFAADGEHVYWMQWTSKDRLDARVISAVSTP